MRIRIAALRELDQHPEIYEDDQLTTMATVPGMASGEDDVEAVLLERVRFCDIEIHCGVDACLG